MGVRIPTRRLAQPALFQTVLPYHTRRPFSATRPSQRDDDSKSSKVPDISNPILEKYLKAEQDRKARETKGTIRRPELEKGTLAPSNIFSEVLPTAQVAPEKVETVSELQRQEKQAQKAADGDALKLIEARRKAKADEEQGLSTREKTLLRMKLDPKPIARQRWERKAVIRSLRRRGRLTRPQELMRTERESVYQSPFLATSVKKLMLLMRQIAGKTVEEALTQMRLSKKRVARDVVRGLEMARDTAVVSRGMGLGGSVGNAKTKTGQPGIEIETRDGKKRVVTDPTQIYVDQAWVGKGQQSHSPEYRARGKVNLLTHRTTCFFLQLKEEKTRMRISNEIKKKRESKKVWIPLPDRPIPSQRQYCLW